jgi:hypothetical protein
MTDLITDPGAECEIGGMNDGTLRVCCSTHQKVLCHHHYCRTHFDEVSPQWHPVYSCDFLEPGGPDA